MTSCKNLPLKKHFSKIAIKSPVALSVQVQDCSSTLPEIPSFTYYLPWQSPGVGWGPWHVWVNLRLEAFSKHRRLVWYIPHRKDMIIFAILFHRPWRLIRQLFLCLIDEKIVLRLDECYFELPEPPPPCIFPKKQTKQMSAAEYTEHIQGHWRNQPALCYHSVLNSDFYSFYTARRHQLQRGQDCTRRTRNTVAEAAVKGWLA